MKNKLGHGKNQMYGVGDVVIRTRHKRGSEQRAWIKIAEPNKWRLRAQVVWESVNGPIPAGMGIHHRDRNKLNDDITNLELVSKSAHLAEHRKEFADRAIKSFVARRKELRWSTKSSTKITGRHPRNCSCPLHTK